MNSNSKILITGSNGLLGQKIVRICLKRGIPFLATSKGENRNPDCPESNYFSLDICQKKAVDALFAEFNPTAVIHTAAVTNVDACETDPELCEAVNVTASKFLFEASKKCLAHFQLLSTDFVFDGEKGKYTETDEVNPLSVYARSKVAAEHLLLESDYTNWSIARTIIVYGTGHQLSRSNIVLWAMDSLEKQTEMKIVDDQFRMPTWADDLAWGCLEIIQRQETGIFHLSGAEYFSMYDLVLEIGRIMGKDTQQVHAISSSTLNQAAKRPPNTGFDLTKAKTRLAYAPTSLKETIAILRNQRTSF